MVEAGRLELYPVEHADAVFQGLLRTSEKTHLFEEGLVVQRSWHFSFELEGHDSGFQVLG